MVSLLGINCTRSKASYSSKSVWFSKASRFERTVPGFRKSKESASHIRFQANVMDSQLIIYLYRVVTFEQNVKQYRIKTTYQKIRQDPAE